MDYPITHTIAHEMNICNQCRVLMNRIYLKKVIIDDTPIFFCEKCILNMFDK